MRIFAEKLRAIYQRGAARDYYDLYQLLGTDSEIDCEPIVFALGVEGGSHVGKADRETNGLPGEQRDAIRQQWETTLPDLTGEPPAFEMVWERLDTTISDQGSR